MKVSSIALVVVLSWIGCNQSRDPSSFVGAFEGDGVVVRLKERDGKLRGLIRMRDATYPAVASFTSSQAKGKFKVDDKLFDFVLTPNGSALVLESGGARYELRRVDNPLANAEPPEASALDGDAQHASDEPAQVADAGTKTDVTAVGSARPVERAGASNAPGDTADKSEQPPKPGPAATAGAHEPRDQAAPSGFDGTFRSTFEGTTAKLRLKQNGRSLTGTLSAEGESMRVVGTVTGSTAAGQLVSPDGKLPFQAALVGTSVRVSFGGVVFDFARIDGSSSGSAGSTGSVGNVGATTTGPATAERNQALVGTWSRTDSLSSGGVSMSTQYFLRISANGTYELGTGKSAGGGADWSMASGDGVQVTDRGQWRTQGAIVLINEGAGWTPYARFYREGSKLMFTFDNGSREIWYRR